MQKGTMPTLNILVLLFLMSPFSRLSHQSIASSPSFRFIQDGAGFSVLQKNGRKGLNCTPQATMTDRTNWPAGFAGGTFEGAIFDGSSMWLVPYNANQLIRIHLVNKTMKGYNRWPTGVSNGGFSGGVFDGSFIWLIPYGAKLVVRIDPVTGNMTGYSGWPTGVSGGGFRGGAFDGTYIWLVPHSANQVVRLDTRSGNMTGYNRWPPGVSGGAMFQGGVFDGTYIWLVPHNANQVVRINPSTGGMTGYNGWPAGKGSYAFAGGVFDGSSIWLVPYFADRVIRVDIGSGKMTGYNRWPAGAGAGGGAYTGGVFDGSAIWLIPYNTVQVVRLDPLTGDMTSYKEWPGGIGSRAGFSGGGFDGNSIWLVPFSTSRVISIDLRCSATRFTPTKSDSVASPSITITGPSRSKTASGVSATMSALSTASKTESLSLSMDLSASSWPASEVTSFTPSRSVLPRRLRPPQPAKTRHHRFSVTANSSIRRPFTSSATFSKSQRQQQQGLHYRRTPSTATVTITALGTLGTVVSAVIGSPLTVTKGPALRALSRVIRCKFVDDDTTPPPFDFPLQASIGSSDFASYVGSGLLTTMILILLPQLIGGSLFFYFRGGKCASMAVVQRVAVIQRQVVANGAVLVFGYFGPITFKLPFLIVWHSRSPSDVAIAVLCPLLVLLFAGLLMYCVVRLVPKCVKVFQRQGSSELDFENRVPGSLFVETFGLLFDAAGSTALVHRLLYFEDFTVATVLQMLDGIRPERSSTCGITATLMAAVCIAHSVYLIASRPYGDRTELILVIVGSLLMSVTALLAMTIAQMDADDDGEVAQLLIAFEYAGTLNNVYFMLQSGILGFAALAEAHKQRLQQRVGWTEGNEGGGAGQDAKSSDGSESKVVELAFEAFDRKGKKCLSPSDTPPPQEGLDHLEVTVPPLLAESILALYTPLVDRGAGPGLHSGTSPRSRLLPLLNSIKQTAPANNPLLF